MANIKKHQIKGTIADYIEKTKQKASVKDLADDGCFVISFKHFDRNQSPSFATWEQSQMLSNAIETIANYCNRPLLEQADGKKFAIYGDFPNKSKYAHPNHVPLDANWARIHINGVHIVAGHVFKNVFYVVFMDNEHSFWETSLQNK